MAENERNVSVSQEPSNGDTVNPDVMCQISVSSPSTLLASVIMSSSRAWRTGTVRRECREMDECQRNTMWKSGCGQRHVFSFSLSSAVCRVSLTPFIHLDGGRKMDAISFLLHFSMLLSVTFTHLTERSSQMWRKQGKDKQTDDSPS